MLVLSRKQYEQIRIGNQVLVTVVEIGPNSVRLGFEAPREVNILRTELETDLSAQEGSDPALAHIVEDRKSA